MNDICYFYQRSVNAQSSGIYLEFLFHRGYLDITDGNRSTIVVDAPAVLLDTIDALGVRAYIIDVHHHSLILVVRFHIFTYGVVYTMLRRIFGNDNVLNKAGSAFAYLVYECDFLCNKAQPISESRLIACVFPDKQF